jgi:hypothetical protein
MLAIERDRFRYSKRPLFAAIEKHGNRVTGPRNSRGKPQLTGAIPLLSHPPVRQPGDMACLESDLNHLSPLLPRCQLEAEWAGILMDEHARPGRLSLLLRSPAIVATCMRSRCLGHLLLVTGWRLGLLTEGKTARTNRAEAWTSYRGQDCENKQDRGLDIIQGGRLREHTG